jgi:hypothetical protein
MGKENKEKKTKKRTIDDVSEAAIDDVPQNVDVEIKKEKKKHRKSSADDSAQIVAVEDVTEPTETESHADESGGEASAAVPDMAHYEKKLKNKLLTREERAAREKQRKMQTYVLELRAKGIDTKEIEKLKKKAKSKMKSMKPNMKLSDIVGKSDQQLECRECGTEFTFTVREQHFYQEKNFAAPVRCKVCYNAKKERMANFDKK